MAFVELFLPPLPEHVRTARLVVVAAARRAGIEDDLVDELRFAVGEACSRAVGLHALHAPGQPVRITIEDGDAVLTVTVADAGPEAGPFPDVSGGLLDETALSSNGRAGDELGELVDPDLSLALLSGLVETTTVEAGTTGTTVTMRWPLPLPAYGAGTATLSRA